jgi:hypothetical protein
VIKSTAQTGVEALQAFDIRAGRVKVREFGLGFNPKLAVPPGSTALPYSYGDAVVRLSLGDNEEIGGEVPRRAVAVLPADDGVGREYELVKDGKRPGERQRGERGPLPPLIALTAENWMVHRRSGVQENLFSEILLISWFSCYGFFDSFQE